MITAIDTNILLDILAPDEEFYSSSAAALERSLSEGSLVVCDLVYAELCVHFGRQGECDEFLDATEIRMEPLSRTAHFVASRAWRTYRQAGGKRSRILADFLIGAHAVTQASRLLSRDRGFYRQMFSGLELIDPSVSRGGRRA